jgi:hypothetical protein
MSACQTINTINIVNPRYQYHQHRRFKIHLIPSPTVNSPFQSGADAHDLENWLEAQPHRFLLLRITADSHDSVIRVTSQFFGHLKGWWLNRKVQAAIPSTFDLLVAELRKTTFLPNIHDDAINAVLNLTQGSMSYALYTLRLNDFLRRSR